MDLEELEVRRWPLPGAGASCALPGGLVKTASEPPPLSLEYLAHRAVDAMQKWAGELPPGMEKVAAQRDDGGELPPPTKDTIWRHPNAHPAALMLLVLDRYGQESFDWEPETLLITMLRDGIQLSNANRTKILAARTALYSPSPWRQWSVLHWVCLGLSGRQPNFTFLEEPEMGYLAAGMDFMRMVDPERDTSDEVDKFVAAVFKKEGLPWIPPPLDFAQRELEAPKYECEQCGAVHRDDNDQRCVTCGSPRLKRLPYEFAGLRDEVKKLWNSVKGLPLETAVDRTPDTAAGNGVYQLLVHWDYVNQVRTQLAQQLRMLGSRK